MKIVACLAWYAEPPAFLHRCVTSLVGICDKIIAYDGAWDLFPHDHHLSPPGQARAIIEAAEAIGIGYASYKPHEKWASQVAKRAALMEDAANYGDWLFVIDGDEYVADGDGHGLRKALAETPCDVAQVMCVRTTGCEAVNIPGRIRRLYRASTGVTVEQAHNGYRTADGRWLHGDGAHARLEPACDTSGFVTLHHERLNRGEERNRAAMGYRLNRNATQVEAWRR
jgi:hypothetical protein